MANKSDLTGGGGGWGVNEKNSKMTLGYMTPVLSGIVVSLALFVLFQWLSGYFSRAGRTLTLVPMAPLTAVLFLLSGIALLAQRRHDGRTGSPLVVRITLIIILLTCLLLLAQFFGILPTDIENALTSSVLSESGFFVGRISPVTTALFIVGSLSLFVSTRHKSSRLVMLADGFALAVLVAAVVIVMGYFYQAPLFYGSLIIPVALLTGISFLLVSTALLFNMPENLLSRLTISQSVTAQICRAILPVIILVMLLFTYLGLTIQRQLDSSFSSTTAVGAALTAVALLVVIVSLASRRIDRQIARKEAALGASIIERNQAEEHLKRAEENFRNSLADSPLGIRIVTVQGELLYANRAILDMYGFDSEEELRNTPVKDRYTPESYTEHQIRRQQRAAGIPVPPNYEISIVNKDGGIRHFSVSRKEVTWNGKTEYQVIYQDITERKKSERKLKEAAEEWQTTFDAINDMISIHDRDFNLVRVNKAFADFLKKETSELIGRKCYELLHGTSEPIASCPFRKTLENKVTVKSEFYEAHFGCFLEISTSPVLNESGEVAGCVHSMRDISERKRMEEQLMLADRLASIGQLASGIAHELNNPLTGVIGFSELLLGRDVPDEIRADLTVINKEAKRTAEIVRGLLTFSRKQKTEKEITEIPKVLQEVLQLRSYEQRVNNIEVKTHFSDSLPPVLANGSQLQQVFINLIVNAEQAMVQANSRGTLTISAEQAGNMVKLSFSDDGPGIKPENVRRLFTPFFTTKEVGKGTGLGLSICHGIVTEHGGSIYAASEYGKGATFIVELPVKSG